MEQYEDVYKTARDYDKIAYAEENRKLDEEAFRIEQREMDEYYHRLQGGKDTYYRKRAQKETLKKQGGVKKESQLWDDED